MIPDIINQIRELTGQERFTIVFDRGGLSKKLFRKLEEEGITFITYLRGTKERVSCEGFNWKW